MNEVVFLVYSRNFFLSSCISKSGGVSNKNDGVMSCKASMFVSLWLVGGVPLIDGIINGYCTVNPWIAIFTKKAIKTFDGTF